MRKIAIAAGVAALLCVGSVAPNRLRWIMRA